MTHNLYRHKVTGIETKLSDRFAAVWGDTFELVEDEPKTTRAPRKAKSTEDSADSVGDASTKAANAASTSDSSKEGNK